MNKKYCIAFHLRAWSISLALTLLIGLVGKGQTYPYGNEWIDYGKTYYKFRVTPNSEFVSNQNNNNQNKGDFNVVHRISSDTLVRYNLGAIPAQDFQLWRNGQEVPLYTSVASGPLGPSDFIEFWGEINDGKPDRGLYRNSTDQFSDRFSLFSDTASYYLTVNAGTANKRFVSVVNTADNTNLPVDTFFMHTVKITYRSIRFGGFGVQIGNEKLRSSSFDAGEGWSETFRPSSNTVGVRNGLGDLRISRNGLPMTFRYAASGDQGINRFFYVFRDSVSPTATNVIIDSVRLRRFTPLRSAALTLSTNLIPNVSGKDSLLISFRSLNNPLRGNDRLMVLNAELTYPRRFSFNTTGCFQFEMPATTTGQFIKIDSFGSALVTNAVILDLTNLERIETVRTVDNEFHFVLRRSETPRKLVFCPIYPAANNIPRLVRNLETKTFTDYAQAPANYLIISNTRLFNHQGENFVQQYVDYRNSAAGGGYQSKVYDVEDFYDQFSFGIRKHPLAVRNFIRYAHDKFPEKPKYVFIVGRGVTYDTYPLIQGSSSTVEQLNLVPTWGSPASDNMLAAHPSNTNTTPLLPIGRLAAVMSTEVRDYLQKVKEFEQLEKTPLGKTWQKNALHLIGGTDANIVTMMTDYMNNYKATLTDTFVAASIKTFTKTNDASTSENNQKIQNAVTAGTGLVSYFGHSSSTSLDFDINNPSELSNNGGKYPFFLVNGCNASDFFTHNNTRLNNVNLTLSERFVLAKQSGAIGFLSSSNFGVLQYLNIIADSWYKAAAHRRYGQGLGDVLQDAIAQNMIAVGPNDFYGRLTAEQYMLHGDPAIRIFSEPQPEFVLDSTSMSISPFAPTIGTDSLTLQIKVYNRSKSWSKDIWLQVIRRIENGAPRIVFKQRITGRINEQLVTIKVPVLGNAERGWNYFTASVDAELEAPEHNESNNVWVDSVYISSNEIKPILPYNYAIVNQAPVRFAASTINPIAEVNTYRIQIDTTEMFNSTQMQQLDVSGNGGTIYFEPALTFVDSTVYYWRTATLGAGSPGRWNTASFTYLESSGAGFDQSHFFQHQKSEFKNIKLDGNNRAYRFDSTKNNLYIDHGTFEISALQDSHSSVSQNGDAKIASGCAGQSLRFNVFDGLNFKPWVNDGTPKYGSVANCGPTRQYNFEFSYYTSAERKKTMDFLDIIPKGAIVTLRMNLNSDLGQPWFTVNNPTGRSDSGRSTTWQKDTLIFGSGKSLYHSLVNQGFKNLAEQSVGQRTIAFIFKKDDTVSFKPIYKISDGLFDRVILSADINMVDTGAVIKSPIFGPAKEWKEVHWRGHLLTANPQPAPSDSLSVSIIGVNNLGQEVDLKTFNRHQQDESIADINATEYPYLRLKLTTNSPASGIPYQLDYWRLNYDPLPEGAVAPELYLNFNRNAVTNAFKDTLSPFLDTLTFGVAFKNISTQPFEDSVTATVSLFDANGKETVLPTQHLKPLAVNDSLHISLQFPTDTLSGDYSLKVTFNPNRLQQEQSLENNTIFKQFFVEPGTDGRAAPDLYENFKKDQVTGLLKDTLMGYKDTLAYGVAFKHLQGQPFVKPMGVELSLINEADSSETIIEEKTLRPVPIQDTVRFNFGGTIDSLSGWYNLRTNFNYNSAEREQTLSNNSYTKRFFVDQGPEAAYDSATFFEFPIDSVKGEYKGTLLASVDLLKFGIAVKNFGRRQFSDSIPVSVRIIADGGQVITVPVSDLEPLTSQSSTQINFEQNTTTMSGWYTLVVTANSARSLHEQDYSNNTYSRRFFVYNIVLPVSLLQFEAAAQKQSVLLSWKATNEQDFSHYEVQTSTNGSQFNAIGSVPATQAPGVHNYQFRHLQPATGQNYYRLKIVNRDGSVQFSSVRRVLFSKKFTVVALPNPFGATLSLQITGGTPSVSIKMFDSKGQLVLQTTATSVATLNTARLASGTYWLLAVNSKGEQMQLKLEKQ